MILTVISTLCNFECHLYWFNKSPAPTKTHSLHWVFDFRSLRNTSSYPWRQNDASTLRLKKIFAYESLQISTVFKSCWSEISSDSRPLAAPGARALRKPCERSSDGLNGVHSLELGSPGCRDTSCYCQQLSGCSLFPCLCPCICCWLLVLVSNIMLTLLCCYSVFFFSSDLPCQRTILWPGSAPSPLSQKGVWPCFENCVFSLSAEILQLSFMKACLLRLFYNHD